MSSKNGNRSAGVALAMLFMVLFFAAIGWRIWASGKAVGIVGPIHIAASRDRVYVSMEGKILVLSLQGRLIEQEPLSELAPTGNVSDLRIMLDGRLLLAMQRPAGIFVCDVDTWDCDIAGSGVQKISAELKVLPDPGGDALFVTDFSGDELWRVPWAGGNPDAMVPSHLLSGPNDIAADPQDHLWIADSGHYRIVELERNPDSSWKSGSAWKVLRTFNARNPLTRDGRDWPTMLVRGADGNWWVTQPDDMLDKADLYVFSPGATQPWLRIPLPESADPTDIIPVGDSILVTDKDRFRIDRVDTTTHQVSQFGDSALLALMRDPKERKAGYLGMVRDAWVGIAGSGVFMLLAAFWATPKSKLFAPRIGIPTLAASDATMPEIQGIHWLRRNDRVEKFIHRGQWSSYPVVFLVLVVVGMLYYLFPHHQGGTPMVVLSKLPKEERKELEVVLLILTYLVAAIPLLTHFRLQNYRARIGTDGARLYVRSSDGRQISIAPESLVYSSRLIAWQDKIFPILFYQGRMFSVAPVLNPMYAKGELEQYVSPLLSRARRVTSKEMSLHMIRNREPGTTLSWILLIVLVGVLTATGGWHYLWHILLHHLHY